MFAFALWDAQRHRLFIARDPMGIKPLYYAQAGSYFLFASEVRTLLGTGLVQPRIDAAGLINYLTFGSAYDPLTLVEGIRAVPPGHMLIWEGGKLRQSSYWDLIDEAGATGSTSLASDAWNEEECAELLQPILEEAVCSQLVSDVPVGVFLSGGIDSSALVSILSRGGITPSTFSIVFREADFSEAQHSRAVAAKFHTDHHEINVSQTDVLAAIPERFERDGPAHHGRDQYLLRIAGNAPGRGEGRSVRSGRGRGVCRLLLIPHRPAHGALRALLEAGAGHSSGPGWLSVRRACARRPIRIASWLPSLAITAGFRIPTSSAACCSRPVSAICCGAIADTPAASDLAAESQCDRLRRASSLDPINRVSYLESRCYMLNTLLRDADFMSMSQGLEVRVPLIDHRLAKAVLALPGHWKLNGTPKKLLVGAMAGSLPDEIVHRPKRGFTLPFEHWMREELRPEIEPVLRKKRIGDGPLGELLDADQVEQVWNEFLKGETSWSRPWSLFVLQRWCELHL